MATNTMITSFNRGGLRPTETKVTTVRELLGIIGGGLKKKRPAVVASTEAEQKQQGCDEPAERMTNATAAEMHGRMGNPSWLSPRLAAFCDEDARPGYDTHKAHEFLDDERVLREKVTLLAQLLRKSKNALAYTGAGISTASGIGDYATRADDASMAAKPKLRSPWEAQPTKAHRVLAALYDANVLKHWNQQNHDVE